eukprot:g48695.t1
MYYKGKDRRTSFQRDFVLAAESGVTANQCGNFGRIGSFHLDEPTIFYYRLHSKQFNSFTIEAVDDYGNLDTPGGTTWQVEDSDCTDYESINKGYYTKAFACNRAGVYSMNVFLAAGPLGSATNPTSMPGNNSALGHLGVNPTAGELVENIQVNLKDCDGNAILRDREEDLINASLTTIMGGLEGPRDWNITFTINGQTGPKGQPQIRPNNTTIMGGLEGPRDWNITFTINGQTGPKGQPQIRPNYWSPARSLAKDCKPDPTYGALVKSGEELECSL